MMTPSYEDTIYALASGLGRSAIAVIRISGPKSRFALETIAGSLPKPRQARYGALRHPTHGGVLDRGIVLFFPGPASDTGEDIAEFQVHGGRAVVASILAALSVLEGFRPAEPGEFAQRALRNGKKDLLDLEALADLIDAETESQRRQAIEGGSLLLRKRAESWRQSLLDIRADLEASIDFSDEDDVARSFVAKSSLLIDHLIADMKQVLSLAQRGERLREGYRVALLGPPNAGKSSLINALAGRDIAIVSEIAGTTRDRIDVFLDLDGLPVIVTDTAGLRVSEDILEQEGMLRSLKAAEDADLILWLVSPEQMHMTPPEHLLAQAKIVLSKSDLMTSPERHGYWSEFSIRHRNGTDVLIQAISAALSSHSYSQDSLLITRERHRYAISRALTILHEARALVSSPELCAEAVQRTSNCMERLLGRVDVEDVLGAIFSRFCIGK